ncbi:uncharacterized protein C1orf131-like [Physella acuta]|uniref:uncharacterized protein C1orf131-like n=1 Tax=Physella acuta TaxID=109671 RepID=UPI0027DD45DE|nr:uncharacterized protein C1orf131-like [Physella acuta]XP_059167168.1 uncharacterized protein C1orf131-like [Physella acuta]XP_059167169.1 uncharacterized protein C1orf131-like [Physella acuta]XP_059167170.1 uncharacterized protein C1orf131-like [Physella acuta]XP_059167171.1 uncharacterized protein C1orf131-like [Physella acuta]
MSAVLKKPVEVVVFNNPQKSAKKHHQEKQLLQKITEGNPQPLIYNQKKAKYDIRKLGISGMDKQTKHSAMVDLLVELGAKPPKNRCYHIKEYTKMIKEKKKEEASKGLPENNKKGRSKRKRDKDDILKDLDGQTGFFKGGVQFVKRFKS